MCFGIQSQHQRCWCWGPHVSDPVQRSLTHILFMLQVPHGGPAGVGVPWRGTDAAGPYHSPYPFPQSWVRDRKPGDKVLVQRVPYGVMLRSRIRHCATVTPSRAGAVTQRHARRHGTVPCYTHGGTLQCHATRLCSPPSSAVTASSPPAGAACDTVHGFARPLLVQGRPHGIEFRPHVVYNAKTKQYVQLSIA